MSGGNNGKVLTVSRKLAKILTDSRKSHHPIEILLYRLYRTKKLSRIRTILIYPQFCKVLSRLRRDIFQSLHKGRKHTFRMKHSPFNLISDSLLPLS